MIASLLASLAFAASPQRPNILVVISDDQSYPHSSAYGSLMVQTPAFDSVARHGVLFTRAMAPSPGCSPSRAALLTGRYPWQLESAGTHASGFPARFDTYPALLEESGYFVGFTGKGWGPGNWKKSGRSQNPAGKEYDRRELPKASREKGISSNDYAANFGDFLAECPAEKPFCFWMGGHEPHRAYDPGIGLRHGKSLAQAEVPPFLPDADDVRSDLLDYAYEIETFDAHLGRAIELLKSSDRLENTIIIVTSDNGMSFPRAKANCYEFGIHVPLAIQWPANVAGGRSIDDPVSFVDLSATIMQAAGVQTQADPPLAGKSLLELLESGKSGVAESSRRYVFSARERHSSSRHGNVGYPQRAIRSRQFLFIRNEEPSRWPAGDPQELNPGERLGPMHGAYYDIDHGPTLSFMVNHRDEPPIRRFFELAVAKRPAEEFFDVEKDPGCLVNIASSPEYAKQVAEHRDALREFRQRTADPRTSGSEGDFDKYPRYSHIRTFPPSP